MKKIVIGIIVSASLLILYNRLDASSDSEHQGIRYEEASAETSDEKAPVKQPQAASVYENNINVIKRYVELAYTHNNKEADITALSEIVSPDILADVKKSFAAAESHYETRVKHARYFVNKDAAVAIFNLKTITKINESEQRYLLEAELKNGKIVDIKSMTRLEH